MNNIVNRVQTMSSAEIAELTGKEKKIIHRDIKVQLIENLYGLDDGADLYHLDIKGISFIFDERKYIKEVQLDRYHTDILVSGYEVKYRAAIVKRWHELEKQVYTQPVITQPTQILIPQQQAQLMIQSDLAIAEMLGVPKHYAAIETVKTVQRETGLDYQPLLLHSTFMDNVIESDEMLEPTELGKLVGMSATQFNRELLLLGLQDKTSNGWEPTALGQQYCSKHAWAKHGKSGYNLKWKKDAVLKMIEEMM